MASAGEYYFNLADAFNENITKVSETQITFTQKTPSGKTVFFSLTLNSKEDAGLWHVDGDRLVVPAGTVIKAQCTERLNEMWLGEVLPVNGGNDYYFGNELNSLADDSRIVGASPNVFVAGLSSNISVGATSITATIQKSWSGDKSLYYLGPWVMVRTEAITLEDLTSADHNVKQQYHAISDDLVGVEVLSLDYRTMLIARSASPVSAAHKHAMKPGQELWMRNGKVPDYANPQTEQYAWVGLVFNNGLNPEDFVGKQFRGVRGGYCTIGTGNHHFFWLNPIISVVSKPTVVAQDVPTALNTYSVANLCEQDGGKYYFMEPRLLELCNLVDVMRVANDAIFTPTDNALLPNGEVNEYTRAGIEGSAALIGTQTQPWNIHAVWSDVDKEHNYEGYRTYNKVFNMTDVLLLACDKPQQELTGHSYPLDVPNLAYETELKEALSIAAYGGARTHVEMARYSDHDFASADLGYFSRYDFDNDVNVYKNDLKVMINNPKIDLNGVHDLVVTRRDQTGANPVTIATLKCTREGVYRVDYDYSTQTALGDSHLVENGKVLGDSHFADAGQEYDLKNE
ncbi:MAG: hypothetical protein IJ626_02730, partial [Muribaculaceae bacterium]|nr:hypothetical protein [Muribaculaceae bacterium]